MGHNILIKIKDASQKASSLTGLIIPGLIYTISGKTTLDLDLLNAPLGEFSYGCFLYPLTSFAVFITDVPTIELTIRAINNSKRQVRQIKN